MKKLMLIIGVLMIAGGISAHGYIGFRPGFGYREVVAPRPYYVAPYVAVRPIVPAYYGYGPAVVCHGCGGYHGGYYRGGRYR